MAIRLGASDLAGLRLLVDTADTGSVSGAARASAVTQPAASEALRRLERRLGLTLLIRTPHGSRPTPAGQQVVALARVALAALDEVAATAATIAAEERHELRIAASYTIAEYVLPGRLPPPSEMTVTLTVVNTEEAMAKLRAHDVDMAFIEGPIDTSDLETWTIARDELVVVTAPGRPWASLPRPLTPHALAVTPLLLREGASGTRRTFEDTMAEAGLGVAPPLGVLTSTAALKAAVRAGIGDTVISRLAVAAEIESGQLVEVPMRGLRMPRDLRAVWSSRAPGPLVDAFLHTVAGASAAAGAARPRSG